MTLREAPRSGTGYPRLLTVGDSAIAVELGDGIDLETNRRVYQLSDALESMKEPAIVELVPTYRSLLIHYDPLRADYADVWGLVRHVLAQSFDDERSQRSVAPVFEIPVLYGGEGGPDLPTVASHATLSPEEVIRIHSSTTYRVYMLGFLPGFPYLGGMDARIACPRLSTPRLRVPAGSVGIAERQTGVYPLDSPGGWQLIGKTPVKLFEPGRNPPVAILPGSYIRFIPIERDEFSAIERRVLAGRYVLPRVEEER